MVGWYLVILGSLHGFCGWIVIFLCQSLHGPCRYTYNWMLLWSLWSNCGLLTIGCLHGPCWWTVTWTPPRPLLVDCGLLTFMTLVCGYLMVARWIQGSCEMVAQNFVNQGCGWKGKAEVCVFFFLLITHLHLPALTYSCLLCCVLKKNFCCAGQM